MIDGFRPIQIDYRERCLALEQVCGIDNSSVGVIRRAFPKMAGEVATILSHLLKRDFVARAGLYAVMYAGRPDCDMPDENVLDVQLHRLRGFLESVPATLNNARGNGWFLSKPDKARIRALIAGAPPADLEACARMADQKAKRLAFLDGA